MYHGKNISVTSMYYTKPMPERYSKIPFS
uniref:Uncharacterized protein n=1 Tax=Arundo donax TaxID=35708 RepID=A0A0A8YZ34_ARUDO